MEKLFEEVNINRSLSVELNQFAFQRDVYLLNETFKEILR